MYINYTFFSFRSLYINNSSIQLTFHQILHNMLVSLLGNQLFHKLWSVLHWHTANSHHQKTACVSLSLGNATWSGWSPLHNQAGTSSNSQPFSVWKDSSVCGTQKSKKWSKFYKRHYLIFHLKSCKVHPEAMKNVISWSNNMSLKRNKKKNNKFSNAPVILSLQINEHPLLNVHPPNMRFWLKH